MNEQRAGPILKDVSFTVERGGALTLVGPSGSGKSSLLRCLNRLEEPTAGTVRVDGRDAQALDPRRLRRGAALVMQTPVVFEGTVRDNLRIRPADVDGDLSEARLGQALADVGLGWTSPPPRSIRPTPPSWWRPSRDCARRAGSASSR
jgi:ABC-type multidrug transport system fused ATPase/permease subunit